MMATPKPVRPPLASPKPRAIAEPASQAAAAITAQEAIAALNSDECRCERPKQYGHALCGHCWHQLPVHLHRELYLRVGFGFEKAYAQAAQLLDRHRARSARV